MGEGEEEVNDDFALVVEEELTEVAVLMRIEDEEEDMLEGEVKELWEGELPSRECCLFLFAHRPSSLKRKRLPVMSTHSNETRYTVM